MDNFRAHLLELRQSGPTVVNGRPMRGALGVLGIFRQQTPSINFHSGTRRAVGSWSQRDVIQNKYSMYMALQLSYCTANTMLSISSETVRSAIWQK